MENSHRVKCIYINSLTHTVEYVERDIQEGISSNGFEYEGVFTLQDHTHYYGLHYNSMTGHHIPRGTSYDHGFLWANFDHDGSIRGRDYYKEVIGNGLLVKFKHRDKQVPIDVDLPLEWVKERIFEFTAGVNRMIPEFTCMLSQKFDDPSVYELLLRVENRDLIEQEYDLHFDKPIRQLTPQMVTFSINYDEVTIIIGKVTDLDDKIRVMIIRNDERDLKQVAAVTISANKASFWIKHSLESFFKDRLINDQLREKGMLSPATSKDNSIA